MYHIIVIPPVEKGNSISMIAKTAYEANCLVNYYTKLGCTVTSEGVE